MNYTEYEGRFFVSPLIGCKGQCIYCYLDSEGIARGDIRKNTLKIKTLLNGIVKNPNYLGGKKGTIISIGAHCDIFPLYEKELIDFSIEWISEILKIGNPVQIISKNAISGGVIKRLINNIEYKNQLLYSTTIITFNYSSIIEKNTSSPFERLKVLEHFKRYGVPTNVMIKPFIPGITNKEKNIFISQMRDAADYCVVGEFYLPNIQVLNSLERLVGTDINLNNCRNAILDCSGSNKYKSIFSKQMEGFVEFLTKNGMRVFKKSSCVNSNILKVNNPGGYYKKGVYCVNCGNCSGE